MIPEGTLEELLSQGENLVSLSERIKEAWLELAKIEEEAGHHEQALKYEGYAQALDSDISQQEGENIGNEGIINTQRLEKYENSINRLKVKGEELNEILSDTHHTVTSSDYTNLIGNAGRQILEYAGEVNELKNQQQAFVDTYEGTEEELKNNKTYIDFENRINSANSAIKELTKSCRDWMDSMLQIGIDKVNSQLDEYDRNLRRIQENVSLNEANGIRKSAEDYAAEDKQYQQIYDDATAQAELLGQGLQFLNLLQLAGVIDPESEYVKNIESMLDTFETRANDAAVNLAKNVHEEELLEINALKDQLTELQAEETRIKSEQTNPDHPNGEVSEASLDDMGINLAEQLDILYKIEEQYRNLKNKYAGTAFGAEMS